MIDNDCQKEDDDNCNRCICNSNLVPSKVHVVPTLKSDTEAHAQTGAIQSNSDILQYTGHGRALGNGAVSDNGPIEIFSCLGIVKATATRRQEQ